MGRLKLRFLDVNITPLKPGYLRLRILKVGLRTSLRTSLRTDLRSMARPQIHGPTSDPWPDHQIYIINEINRLIRPFDCIYLRISQISLKSGGWVVPGAYPPGTHPAPPRVHPRRHAAGHRTAVHSAVPRVNIAVGSNP